MFRMNDDSFISFHMVLVSVSLLLETRQTYDSHNHSVAAVIQKYFHFKIYLRISKWNLSSDKYRLVHFICFGIFFLVAFSYEHIFTYLNWPFTLASKWVSLSLATKVVMHKHYVRCHLNECVSQTIKKIYIWERSWLW